MRRRLSSLFMLAALPALALAQPATLSATERAIADAVGARNPAVLSLLEQIVNINSGTHNFAGMR